MLYKCIENCMQLFNFNNYIKILNEQYLTLFVYNYC